MATKLFSESILNTIRKAQVIGIKAGKGRHRVIAVWAVVVNNRVFIRSWSLKTQSWYAAFRENPTGELHIAGRKIRIRPVFVRSESLKNKISAAYAEKYHTPGSLRFVREMSRRKSRNTSTGLVPIR
ncbi:MAG: DUF2255 family protein [Bacteroidota bacterium]